MAEPDSALTCGCRVETRRDFLGRAVGTIIVHDDRCGREDHQPGHVVLMPGRENAGQGGDITRPAGDSR